METATENRIVLVVRATRLDELVARFNQISQARFYIEKLGADFSDYQREDEVYKKVLAETKALLSRLGHLHVVGRDFLPNFVFGKNDTVVALGQDGLVANILKYLKGQNLIGVNPDPSRWDGVLLPFQAGDLEKILPEVFANRRKIKDVTLAEMTLNDGQSLLAVNDFFIGVKSHTSARYEIVLGSKSEHQSSSGIIVSTGLGSTGWFKSVLAGAAEITGSLSKTKLNVAFPTSFAWDAPHLYFSVREPWPSKTTGATLVFGKITAKEPLIVKSTMPENGVIFSDGVEKDFLSFNSGAEGRVGIARQKGHLVV